MDTKTKEQKLPRQLPAAITSAAQATSTQNTCLSYLLAVLIVPMFLLVFFLPSILFGLGTQFGIRALVIIGAILAALIGLIMIIMFVMDRQSLIRCRTCPNNCEFSQYARSAKKTWLDYSSLIVNLCWLISPGMMWAGYAEPPESNSHLSMILRIAGVVLISLANLRFCLPDEKKPSNCAHCFNIRNPDEQYVPSVPGNRQQPSVTVSQTPQTMPPTYQTAEPGNVTIVICTEQPPVYQS